MSTETRLNFSPNLVVGITILLLGIALTLDRLQLLEARALLQYWPVVLVLFGASVAIQALRGGPATAADGQGEKPIVSPGFVIFVAIAALLFFNMPQRRGATAQGESSDGTVTLFSVMGRDDRTSFATPFRGGQVTTVMGRSELDLRPATLASGEAATIDVFVVMGEAIIRVPKGWTVDTEAVSVMGKFRDYRPREERERERLASGSQTAPPPRVVLRGTIMMGGLVIRS